MALEVINLREIPNPLDIIRKVPPVDIVCYGRSSEPCWEPASLPADGRAPVSNWGREAGCHPYTVATWRIGAPVPLGLQSLCPCLLCTTPLGATKPPAFRFNVCSFSILGVFNSVLCFLFILVLFPQYHTSMVGKKHPVSVGEHPSLPKTPSSPLIKVKAVGS